MDGLINAQLEAHHIAGAAVAVVADGRILLEKGYGYADVDARRPVDPRRTLFRIASNSKMFVWTAVMQLVDEGRLDLHTDVNHYLHGVRIPATYGEPITLAHLMTHTPGFEDTELGVWSREFPGETTLLESVREHMPQRIFPPGEVMAYSSFGAVLAALIVEQVSGVPYSRHLQERILDPLGMTRTTLAGPVPKALRADLAKGYRWLDGRFVEQPFIFTPWAAPAGAISSTAHDMARFMIAHLNDGVLDGTRILSAEAARRMREDLIPVSPAINTFLHGFEQLDINGESAFGHEGDYQYFQCITAMLPERNKGVFIVFNTEASRPIPAEFFGTFMDHYYPAPPPAKPAPPSEPQADLERFVGPYGPTRRSESDITKMVILAGAVSMSVEKSGYLVSRSALGTRRWRQVEPLLFAEVDGRGRLAFREDDAGEIRYAYMSNVSGPTPALEKQPWWNAKSVNRTVQVLSLLILATGLIGFPIAAVLQRGRATPVTAKLARLAGWLTSAVFLGGWLAVVPLMQYGAELSFGAPPGLRVAYLLWAVGAMLSIALIAFTVAAWRRQWWLLPGRLSYTLVSVAAVGLVAWHAHWNLLGFTP